MILVTPELDVPLPFSLTVEEATSLHEKAKAAFSTVEFLAAMGMEVTTPTDKDRKEARAQFLDSPFAVAEIATSGKALILKSLLNEYDVEVARNAAQIRSYIKMRLLELTDSNKETVQLKALELLGKVADVGAFAERVDINVTHRTTEELQTELANKLAAYMDDIVDVEAKTLTQTPDQVADDFLRKAPAVQIIDIDEELGMVGNELPEPVTLDDDPL
jgi:hypothetical protein